MESLNQFIQELEIEFEEFPKGELKPDSNFSDFIAWSSMNSLLIIAFIRMEYDIEVKWNELEDVRTPRDLFLLLKGKK